MELLARWWRKTPSPTRWVVLDVESSGLDPWHDRLLAIAAIGVRADAAAAGLKLRIDLDDSFEVVIRHEPVGTPDKPNILVHGIGVGAQAAGVPAAEALAAFERFAGDAPLIGFHAGFDRALIERASRAALGRVPRNAWLDVEQVAVASQPPPAAKSLDEWMARFGIVCAARHQAAADTLATAELLLALLPAAAKQGVRDFAGLRRLAAGHRWVREQGPR